MGGGVFRSFFQRITMDKPDTHKKMIIISSSNPSSNNANLYARMKEQLENAKEAMILLSETGIAASQAGSNLNKALKELSNSQLKCPDDMINIEMDFNKLEHITIDSLSGSFPETVNFAEQCYDESGYISKKTWKKLQKNIKKLQLPKQKSQKEIWCNKWDKKIKRNL